MYTNFFLFVTLHNFQFLLDATTFVVSVLKMNKTTHQPINKPINYNFQLFVSHHFIERGYVIMPLFLCYTAVQSNVNMRNAALYYV